MKPRHAWLYYKGIEYIRLDFSNLTDDETIIGMSRLTINDVLKRPDNSVLSLCYTKGVRTTPLVMRELQQVGKIVRPKLKKSACVGPTGLLVLLLRIYIAATGSPMRFFTDEESALEYLTS